MAEKVFAVEGAVAGAGVPAFSGMVEVVVALGDGLEYRRAAVCEAVEQRVEMAASCGQSLVAAGDEGGPERGDGAGSGGGAGGAGDENLAAVAGVGWAGDVGDSAAALAGGAQGDACLPLPWGDGEFAADSATGRALNAVVTGVPDDLLFVLRAGKFGGGASAGEAVGAAGGEVDGGEVVGGVVERACVTGGREDGDAEVGGGQEGFVDGVDVGVGESDLAVRRS